MSTLRLGQKVKLLTTDEVGVVVWIWKNQYGDTDTFVAFFGEKFPEGEPEKGPYMNGAKLRGSIVTFRDLGKTTQS